MLADRQLVVDQYEVHHHFDESIILSNEAHFHLDGYINKQNFRI